MITGVKSFFTVAAVAFFYFSIGVFYCRAAVAILLLLKIK